ncbi:hypothetical protein SteCoe_2477 [Stentor coeruleus]|uniref:Translin-associated factor X-interacting protein 1 N-terminal domain-containing protein n=1 Tax=Stentor coeruleus TaxID=5963 RepID=A0A1R2CZL5_9CILI|nr:hypothetical protein SteCoe_2477 [Stentor coeruleus]
MSNGPRNAQTLDKIKLNRSISKDRVIIRSTTSIIEKLDVHKNDFMKNLAESLSPTSGTKAKSPSHNHSVVNSHKIKAKHLKNKDKSVIYAPFKHLFPHKTYEGLNNFPSHTQVKTDYQNSIASINLENDSKVRFEACKHLFDEIKDNKNELAPVIKFVLKEFESYTHLQEQKIESQAESLLKLESEKKMLLWEMHKIVNQNRTFAENIEKLENIINKMVLKFNEIAHIDAKSLEKTDENWDLIAKENTLFKEELNVAHHQTHLYRAKAKKLQKILLELEKVGVFIPQLHAKEITQKFTQEDNQADDDNIDNENLVSGKQPSVVKPLEVPLLTLQNKNENPNLH